MKSIMYEEYGPRVNAGILEFRIKPGPCMEVFTVGKWRPLGVDFQRRQVQNGRLTPRLRQLVLISLVRNGGLIPGVRAEDHGFLEVK